MRLTIKLLATLLLVCLLAGCARRPHRIEPIAFRRCVLTNEAPGFVGCDCKKPIVAWDAQLKRKVVYCDGKVQ
jgi:hypothetical protein